jgi:hypothetical protein
MPVALAVLAAGAVPAHAQTLSAAPCVVGVSAPALGAPKPKVPVHAEGWSGGRSGGLVFLRWLDGRMNEDGSRSESSAGSAEAVAGATAWDGQATLPDAVDFLGAQVPPGAWPFTLLARSNATDAAGNLVEISAQTATTVVQPGVTVAGLPRIKRRGIVGRSRLTLWGVDPALNGRRLYGHVLRSEAGGQLRSFPAGVADADPCTPVQVPRRVLLLAKRGGFSQWIRFTDTKRYSRAHDMPVLSFRLLVDAKGRTEVQLGRDAVYAGAPLPDARVRPR